MKKATNILKINIIWFTCVALLLFSGCGVESGSVGRTGNADNTAKIEEHVAKTEPNEATTTEDVDTELADENDKIEFDKNDKIESDKNKADEPAELVDETDDGSQGDGPDAINNGETKDEIKDEPSEESNQDNTSSNTPTSGNLEIHFIDVGQGDAALIKCDGEAMLIDAGDNDKGTTVQLYLKKQDVSELKYLVGTHPDADHIGGLDVIITKFNVTSGEVWMPDMDKDTATYRDVVDAIEYKSLKRRCPSVGETFELGNAVITVLGPIYEYDDANNNSIVLKIQNGNNTFLFMGDASEEEEGDLISKNKTALDADVLKVGHHGSKYSTGSRFLSNVSPEYAVISVSSDNEYGHPTAECLNNLRAVGVKVFRTDEQGSIVATSDGESITWNCSPSDTWQAGEYTGTGSTDNNNDNGFVPASNGGDTATSPPDNSTTITYILNKNTKKFHYPNCSSVGDMAEKNKEPVTCGRDEVIARGYVPCKRCNP